MNTLDTRKICIILQTFYEIRIHSSVFVIVCACVSVRISWRSRIHRLFKFELYSQPSDYRSTGARDGRETFEKFPPLRRRSVAVTSLLLAPISTLTV